MPALHRLYHSCARPYRRRGVLGRRLHGEPTAPSSHLALPAREAELACAAVFVKEMGATAQAKEQLDKDLFAFGRLERRLKRLNVHLIEET